MNMQRLLHTLEEMLVESQLLPHYLPVSWATTPTCCTGAKMRGDGVFGRGQRAGAGSVRTCRPAGRPGPAASARQDGSTPPPAAPLRQGSAEDAEPCPTVADGAHCQRRTVEAGALLRDWGCYWELAHHSYCCCWSGWLEGWARIPGPPARRWRVSVLPRPPRGSACETAALLAGSDEGPTADQGPRGMEAARRRARSRAVAELAGEAPHRPRARPPHRLRGPGLWLPLVAGRLLPLLNLLSCDAWDDEAWEDIEETLIMCTWVWRCPRDHSRVSGTR